MSDSTPQPQNSGRGEARGYTVAVDFDGVIHRYDTPFIDAVTIPDEPVEGAIEWLREIGKRFKVVIFTTRGKTLEGREAVADWLTQHDRITWPHEVTAEKPPALVYVDDRAYRFDGSNFPSPHEIHQLRPWHKERDPSHD